MSDDKTTEYVTAFIVGAALGVGAALLLAPDPPTRRERVMKELKPYRKKLHKKTQKLRKDAGKHMAATGDWGEDLAAASRAVVQDIREEVADMVADARDQIAHRGEPARFGPQRPPQGRETDPQLSGF